MIPVREGVIRQVWKARKGAPLLGFVRSVRLRGLDRHFAGQCCVFCVLVNALRDGEWCAERQRAFAVRKFGEENGEALRLVVASF
jgi:hypothetical protein